MSTTESWDVVLIGAGPAGAVSALLAAREGWRTLLVDRGRFPRPKVCGSCINVGALDVLKSMGLDLYRHFPDVSRTNRVAFYLAGKPVQLPLAGGVAISREELDDWLVKEACAAGATFMEETTAKVGEWSSGRRVVRLRGAKSKESGSVVARAVVCATGIHPTGIEGIRWQSPRWRENRIGVGAILHHDAYEVGGDEIKLVVEREGYVGFVQLGNGMIDMAAAISPSFVREKGKLADAINTLLNKRGMEPLNTDTTNLRGTPPLTRRANRVGLPGLFLVGDAAGYCEPFSGEGIQWAMESATRAVPLMKRLVHGESPERISREWNLEWRRMMGGRWNRCLVLSTALRYPRLLEILLRCVPRSGKTREKLAAAFSGKS